MQQIGMIIPSILSDEEIWFRLVMCVAQHYPSKYWSQDLISRVSYFLACAALEGRKTQQFSN